MQNKKLKILENKENYLINNFLFVLIIYLRYHYSYNKENNNFSIILKLNFKIYLNIFSFNP